MTLAEFSSSSTVSASHPYACYTPNEKPDGTRLCEKHFPDTSNLGPNVYLVCTWDDGAHFNCEEADSCSEGATLIRDKICDETDLPVKEDKGTTEEFLKKSPKNQSPINP
jgi:hypothetical protein